MTLTQKRSLSVAVIIALSFGAYFLRGYFSLIVLAAILAFLYNPSYNWFLTKTKGKSGISITLTMIFALFSIVIPLTILLALTINQAIQFIDDIKAASIDSESTKQTITNLLSTFNETVQRIPGQGSTTFSLDSATSWFKDNISAITTTIVDYIVSVVGGFSTFFTQSIIFIFVFMSFLKNQTSILNAIKKINPLGEEASDLYMSRISAMTKAMVKGQFIIAFMQGTVDALLLWLVGFDYFFFWLVILTFLSIIPLGGGIIVLPIGFVLLITGHIWEGLVLILGHLLIVTNIDNIFRPKLVPKSARLDSALTILSVFAGISMFGFLGIVLGPVIMIVIVTTIRLYLDFIASKNNSEKLKKLYK